MKSTVQIGRRDGSWKTWQVSVFVLRRVASPPTLWPVGERTHRAVRIREYCVLTTCHSLSGSGHQ
ncbi:unnamed protein product [Periconia digitata]|uniref:Uncharacterized protein n=1 Tax=Periconia digitata TaxID=1303443 RepID=A0A9W4USB2_9PLEO|nr:unnamed protein product [Periconia digitata]